MEAHALQIHSLDLFSGISSYIDNKRLYYSYFKKIPTIKTITGINNTRLRKWLDKEWKHKIAKEHARQEYDRERKEIRYIDLIYLLNDNLLINLEGSSVTILHDVDQGNIANEYLLLFKKFTQRTCKTQSICLVVSGERGLQTSSIRIKKPKLVLSKNYNDDLPLLHKKMVSLLKEKDKSGLYLFHGIPGTGKSTYIRYLIRCINKTVIFMPPGLAGNLDSPSVANLLLFNPNTVFVIEDAEELLTSRDAGRNSSISMLLNLTDGLLGESLGIQVIATFNTNLQNIDKALLRKGRLLALYDFKPLAVDKSKALLNEMGVLNYPVHEPMSLADIFNTQDEVFEHKKINRPQIGFLSNTG